ncbi:Rod shape-determining protein MreC [Candidatus Methylomirabilis lanthanidiphila]|uniref:Cell shape-determining protein MreC n=1 Tax=Candidatus Methylomirabilis lanthanidiphila TaxID=2211376 RepID=A0A564ZLG9_9BACT|nr:rod shape-determining protein MreC [Candidatus Methylomirabilis lanthanidiphila]VUZ85398.1 Rod shape-determining protein MreC [Candidatus Methylomirabilis lanthanidiphila]
MTRLLLRYRRTLVLSTALLLAFVLMTLQVRGDSSVALITKRILLASISPFLQLATWSFDITATVWNEYVDLRRVRRDNQLLKEDVRQLRTEVDELRETALEHSRLSRLLQLGNRVDTETVVAKVIGKDTTNWFRSILIDMGANRDIRRHMAVITSEGLVGRVVDVTTSAARVQLITDPESAAGVLIQRSRAIGVAAGSQGGAIQIKYLPLMADVAVGDRIITSGMGGIFPKGIPVGTVVRSSRPTNGTLFQLIEAQPYVDLSRLEEVMVLKRAPSSGLSWAGQESPP